MAVRKNHLLLLVLTLFVGSIAAQTTTISGVLYGAEGREILLLESADRLTKEPVVKARQTIQSDGTFSFTFNNEQIELLTLMVSFYRIDIFAVPHFHHQLYGEKFVYDDYMNPFFNQPLLPFQFSKNDTLNRYIIDFEKKLEDFEYFNLPQLRDGQKVSLFDSLNKVPQKCPVSLRPFLEKYIHYTIATHKVNYYLQKPFALGKQLLYAQNPDPYDFCYMRFFNTYFDNYFPNHRSDITLRDIQDMISSQQSIEKLLDYLGKDSLLIDEDLRELVCLKILMDHFGSQKATIQMIQKLAQNTHFEKNRVVANNIIKIVTHLKTGTTAPEFSLLQSDGTMFHSQALRGKYLYIMFFKTNCTACLFEMEQMRMVYEKNKDFFEFVAISLDDKKSDFLAFTKHYQYPWKVLYAGMNYDFVQQWQTKNLPLQALISKNYKIMEYPTLNIQDGIIQKIEKISWDENRLRRQQRH
ncbi:MAG: TlpA disulfide reductase family protein [Bacteroidales bacterium]|nr:TlpA disulfide reductase family protein [Bacteroidales bacterium]